MIQAISARGTSQANRKNSQLTSRQHDFICEFSSVVACAREEPETVTLRFEFLCSLNYLV